MEIHDLSSWEEFRPLVKSIREKYGVWEYGSTGFKSTNTVLFRGLPDSGWELSTTLERRSSKACSVERYMLNASRCLHEIESYTGRDWRVAGLPDVEREIAERQTDFRPHLPHYDFLVYLRHHGFPSPLLDWTASPYIAAYFAYVHKSAADRVVVYAYVETPEGGKGWTGNPPLIHVMGPHVSTDTRHFSQKAWYTVTTQFDEGKQKHFFKPHSAVFDHGDQHQDLLIRISLPSSDRVEALKELEDYNINAFTLFQNEDALVSTLALRQFDLRDA